MLFKTRVLKIFKNFTVKRLCWSLFLITLLKKESNRFFTDKFSKFLQTPFFYRRPPVAASIFCKDFVDMIILILILEDPMWLQLFYFLNTISFWFAECLLSIDGTLTLANYFRVLQILMFSILLKSAIMENSRHRIN